MYLVLKNAYDGKMIVDAGPDYLKFSSKHVISKYVDVWNVTIESGLVLLEINSLDVPRAQQLAEFFAGLAGGCFKPGSSPEEMLYNKDYDEKGRE